MSQREKFVSHQYMLTAAVLRKQFIELNGKLVSTAHNFIECIVANDFTTSASLPQRASGDCE